MEFDTLTFAVVWQVVQPFVIVLSVVFAIIIIAYIVYCQTRPKRYADYETKYILYSDTSRITLDTSAAEAYLKLDTPQLKLGKEDGYYTLSKDSDATGCTSSSAGGADRV